MNKNTLNAGPPRTVNTGPSGAPNTGPSGAKPPMSADDFALWGMAHVAYVRPLELDGRMMVGIFAANGQRMGLTENWDLARAVVIQNDLEPLSVH